MKNEHQRLKKLLELSKKNKNSSGKFILGTRQVEKLIAEYEAYQQKKVTSTRVEEPVKKRHVTDLDGGSFK